MNIFGGVGVVPPATNAIGGVWTGTLNVTVAGTYLLTASTTDPNIAPVQLTQITIQPAVTH